jgi:hypothetical protein
MRERTSPAALLPVCSDPTPPEHYGFVATLGEDTVAQLTREGNHPASATAMRVFK